MALVLGCGFLARAAAHYEPMNPRVRLTSTNLPIVWLEVDGTVDRYERITARMKIIDNGNGRLNYADTVAHPGQHVDYDGYIGLRYRGNSSYTYSAKKPYSLRPLDRPLEQGGTWQRVSLLGMPRDSKWALLAPYNDKSLMRDILAFEISRPWMEFTPDGRFCEVLCNGIYYGVFLLTEVVSAGKNRLNLDDPGEEGDALTGGYLMEVDRNDEPHYVSMFRPVCSDGSIIWTTLVYYQYKWPDYEDWTEAQLAYIQDEINKMETAMASGFRDPETGECLYIDEMSFIDYQLAMEIGHNVDAYRLSGKFFKRRDSEDPRFKMVVWDMNLAYGNANYFEGWRTDTWMYQVNDILPKKASTDMVPFWWYKLNKEHRYARHLRERWAQYRQSNLRMNRVLATVDSLAHVLTVGGAESRNSKAYPVWGVYVWPNYHVSANFAEEVAFLKSWLVRRIRWMDEQLGFVPDLPPGDVNGDSEVSLGDLGTLIDIILGGDTDEDTLGRADVNGDGELGLSDVNALIDLMMM